LHQAGSSSSAVVDRGDALAARWDTAHRVGL